MDWSLSVWSIVGAAFVLAGFVKGMIGIGLPTVALGLLALVMTPGEGSAVLLVPLLVTNAWQMAVGPALGALVRRLAGMMIGIVAGTLAAGFSDAGLLTGPNSGRATAALGLALMIYALIGLSSVRLSVPSNVEPWLSPLIGAVTGIVSAATGVFAIPALPYLQALDLDRDNLVQALGLSFTVSSLALAVLLTRDGFLQTMSVELSFLALAPAIAGMLAGQWLRGRVRASVFRLCFLLGLLGLGAHLTSRVLW
jgi:uncharacterized membrane protein YfcA